MSERNSHLLTIGQFASLHKINKKTLMWYDQVGLFKPVLVKENAYRYYSYQQSTTLETILMLRELDVSIQEIKSFIENKSEVTLKNLLNEKIKETEIKIKQMKTIQKAMIHQLDHLESLTDIDLSAIEIITKEEQPLLLLKTSKHSSLEKEIKMLIQETKRYQDNHLYNTNYGSVLSVENIYKQKFEDYDYISLSLPLHYKKHCNHVCPKGKYIRAYVKGSWDQIPQKYNEILEYANHHHIQLYGYAYETGINENIIDSFDDYITMIEIPIVE